MKAKIVIEFDSCSGELTKIKDYEKMESKHGALMIADVLNDAYVMTWDDFVSQSKKMRELAKTLPTKKKTKKQAEKSCR